jgi:pimeloyl-ACP methyl ester carboxylesterase
MRDDLTKRATEAAPISRTARRGLLLGIIGVTTLPHVAAKLATASDRAAPAQPRGAVNAPNRFVEVGGRRLAYRSIGEGTPLLLATRFRGNMDVWDPAFLDALAGQGFRVITFDYTGLGLSTGEPTYNPVAMARDIEDLITGLGLGRAVVGGWSLGGMVAQAALARVPHLISHLVLIGTVPPGPAVRLSEQLFYDTAAIAEYGLEEETILFFEPRSAMSREAARRSAERIAARIAERSRPIPVDWARQRLSGGVRNPPFPADAVLEAMKRTTTPILHLGGDHDPAFPVENWYALGGALPTLQLVTYPQAGHGPQHQHPEMAAAHIATFVQGTAAGV